MIIGCTLPLLLILLLPFLGITGKYTFFLFVVAMFACHLFMPMHHGEHKQYSETNKMIKNESHKH